MTHRRRKATPPARTPLAPLDPPRPHIHALDCACGLCELDPRPSTDLDKRHYTRLLKVGENPPTVREGDHVWIEWGEYRGCILDLVKIEYDPTGGGYTTYVCGRTTFPYEIRTKHVSLYRRVPCAS